MLLFHATPLADRGRARSTAIGRAGSFSPMRRWGSGQFNAWFRIANIDGVVEQIQRIFDTSVDKACRAVSCCSADDGRTTIFLFFGRARCGDSGETAIF